MARGRLTSSPRPKQTELLPSEKADRFLSHLTTQTEDSGYRCCFHLAMVNSDEAQ